MHQQPVLQIQSLTRKISKRQAEFNTLNRKIEELTQVIRALKIGQEDLYQRMHSEVHPLQRRIVEDRITMILKLDQLYDKADFTTKELRKLSHFISTMSWQLIEVHEAETLIPIFDKYSDTDYATLTNTSVATKREWVDEQQEVQYEETYFEENLEEWAYDKEAYKEQYKKEKNAKRSGKANPKKEQKLYKSVRALYLDLVKAFHPDKEPLEEERVRKTEIMHRVTEAYRQNDLQRLLQLQMEFNHIDQQHLDRLQDDQLVYYNTILLQQIEELEQQKMEIAIDLSQFVSLPSEKINTIEQVYFQFNADVKNLKKTAKGLRNELPLWGREDVIKDFLKNYQVE